ncbi:hypothetical protein Amn_pb00220 (plasmid) [Aminobacter sp. Y103A]|uniref:HvfC/BufC N-terminal domain-containing protein n=1 Tax=Aminobacter sp. Y103A TaxID=1870862 RepID=UPI00257328CA|nr:DNA-binding domain-containing protein [Aminobacter sp. SS-2016]BBD41031.1 hypothetical protein Amn_pb00220 [Aminobacter sp. SS-2016]
MRPPEERLELRKLEASYAADFASALLHPARATPAVVAGPNGSGVERRYNVYRNNVTVSLIDALSAAFPAVLRITGPDFFRAMARSHVRAAPPTSPLLFEYGRGFPAFIDGYEYARQMPWLADVARIERAWLDAYHAADAAPLRPEQLASVPLDALESTRFEAHPATRILRSSFPAVSIFAANRVDRPVGAIDATGPEIALVTRPALEVVVARIAPGAAAFLDRLVEGAALGAAADAAFAADPDFDLALAIAGMLEAGAFSTIAAEEDSDA